MSQVEKPELEWTSIRTGDVPRSPGWYIVLAPGRAPSIYAKPFLTEDPVAVLRDMERGGVTHWLCKLPEFPEGDFKTRAWGYEDGKVGPIPDRSRR